MSQRQQLERICEIDRQIRGGMYPNANKLSNEIEVSRRVIYMDREFMINRLGAPIEYDRERSGWYYTNPTWMLPNIMVSEGELLAFFLSVEVARKYFGTDLEKALRSAVGKIAQTIRGPVSIDLETLQRHYTFAAPALSTVREEVLMDLHQAVRENRCLWMQYYTASRDEHTERTVQPYHLYNLRGDWYLIAFDGMRQEFRSFAASRIEAWRMLEQHFTRDPVFSIDRYMESAFLTERGKIIVPVAVRFNTQQARYIRERRWHETQEIEELPDGGLILRFQAGGLEEVQRWVMQYGSRAEVLEPEELREMVNDEILKMTQIYRA